MIASFLADERGLETVEWAIVAPLILLGVLGAFGLLGTKTAALLARVNASIP